MPFLLRVSSTLHPPPKSPLFSYTTLFRSRDRRLHGNAGDPDQQPRPAGRAREARRDDAGDDGHRDAPDRRALDRKSTRLNSSHITISYAVFCLKKKTSRNDSLGRTVPCCE